MLNEFKLFAAVNESVNNAALYENNIEPYPFTGLDCVEAMHEASYMIMSEAAAYDELSAGVDELLVEAIMTNPEAVDSLSESVLTNIGKAFKKIIDKLIAAVRGLIEKIKAFFAKFTGQTDKWLKIMEPKVNAAKDSDVKYSMYKWDEAFILTGIKDGIGKMKEEWKKEYGAASYAKLVEKAKSLASKNAKREEVDAGELNVGGGQSKDLKEKLENISDRMLKSIQDNIGTDGTTPQEALNAVLKKAHGNVSEKEDIAVAPNKKSYLDFIRGAKKNITDLQNQYKDTLNELNKYKAEIDKTSNIAIAGENDMKGNAAAAARSALKTEIDYHVKFTTQYVNAMNTLGSINIGAIRDCAKEYMGALTALVNYKEKKD